MDSAQDMNFWSHCESDFEPPAFLSHRALVVRQFWNKHFISMVYFFPHLNCVYIQQSNFVTRYEDIL